ncbi:hypothetical protein DFH09DRAFT_899640 [Mycena vulgaris]|nr:hypothetical protein DFH09DRAFT_899640 [Mycena vulgaris]
MPQSTTFTRWAVPSTPQPPNQPLSAHNSGIPHVSRTQVPRELARPLKESHFYGQIQFGSIRTPDKDFDYSPPKKRCRAAFQADENIAPAGSTSSSPSPPDAAEPPNKRSRLNSPLPHPGTTSGKRKSPRTDAQKIELILETIQDQGWTLGCFLYNIFRTRDIKGNEIHRSSTHSQMVSIFLAGRAKKTVANIITEWMAHPDGRIPAHSPNLDLMYSTTVPYNDIKPVRAALTAFSTQTIGKKVGDEAENAVKLSSGLHVSIGKKHPETKLRREDFGEGTIPRVQVLAYFYTCQVITHAIASLNFCRTDQANLLPLMRGILYFGSSAPVELMNYNSMIGNMPAPATIRRALISLSTEEARATQAHGQDPDTAGFLLVDNCQNYHRQRDLRIGRENVMNIGMSGLYMEAPDVDVNVFNLADKRKLIAQNRRKDLTVDDLLGFLDQADADLTGALHFLDTLVRCTPSLRSLSKEIAVRLSATAKISLPPGQAVVHPLASSGKKETIPTELKSGMLDFLQQVGQTPESYLKRKLPVGGDGLTFAMLLQLQTYLQFHDDAFKSFEIMEPQLQVWHTKWTDVMRIFQTHWGPLTGKSTNPASLGFSAAKIGRAAPSNMKKVEFYPGTQLLYLILDAKVLDIWRLAFKTDDIFTYFDGLESTGNLPDFETLLPMARKLYRAYGTARGRDHAMYDTGTESEWAQTVPRGSSWVPSEIEHSSLDTKKRKAKKKTAEQQAKKPRKSKAKPAPKPCTGDFVFAQNVDFIRDGMNSRKLTTAVARGDISRMYECIKYLLFTFGGSTHTNYLNYILETIMNLELECSPGLKVALLRGLIWNLSGITGHCEEGDFIVEFFNRLLEDVVEHKSAQFDDIFIRDIISRNLRHIAQLKVAWRTGLGMEKKSHKHADPHTKPEMRTLLKLYKDTELHSQRLGRQIDDRDTDDFARGVKKLREGALQASIGKTTSNQQVFRTDTVTPPTGTDVANHADDAADDNEGPLELSEEESESSSDNSDSDLAESESDEDSSMDNIYATRGSTFLVDGELVFDERDMLVGPEDEVLDSESEEQEPGDN